MLTISILNYRNWHATDACIRSLFAACADMDYRVVVRDNSEVSEIAALRASLGSRFASLHYFESPDNPGFGRGHNLNYQAFHHGSDDLFLVLNNDVLVPETGVIQSMRMACTSSRLVSCVIRTRRGKVWFSGGTISRLTGDLVIDRSAFPGSHRTTGFISGCCLMASARLYQKLGGFDERFFMYAEDLDLCMRARRVGAELVVVNQSIVHNVGSGEKGLYSDLYLYENTKNRHICLRRHQSGVAFVRRGYFFLKYGLARSVQLALFSRNPASQIQIVRLGMLHGSSPWPRACTHSRAPLVKFASRQSGELGPRRDKKWQLLGALYGSDLTQNVSLHRSSSKHVTA